QIFLQERGPLDDPHLDVHPELPERGLDDLRHLATLLVALVRHELEAERLTVLDEDSVGVLVLPARLGEENARPLEVVRVRLHARIVRPRTRLVGPGGLAAHTQEYAIDDLALVDG